MWRAGDILANLPRLMHEEVRRSKYYTPGSDSWTIQAQTHRSRTANLDENQKKFAQEVERIYSETIPGQTEETTKEKYREL